MKYFTQANNYKNGNSVKLLGYVQRT